MKRCAITEMAELRDMLDDNACRDDVLLRRE
jgi:hypothetical protein